MIFLEQTMCTGWIHFLIVWKLFTWTDTGGNS